ncbi:MAG: SurA N-terminal domain-containing protein [Bacteroidales bacterium]|jgi:peptidyl-prolyl cis-trans isomerase D|nr:SurA N-terminal domain-containing protein [Bacteroidales bacterium]
MAAIGEIRKHYGILVAIIAIALAAFILGDFAKGGSRTPNNIGVVEGEEISYQSFSKQVEKSLEAQKQNSGQNQVETAEVFNIKLSVWNQMVRQIIMQKEFDELGITVTAADLFDQVQGRNPHRYILQYFSNPETGEYNPQLVLNYLQNLDQMPRENQLQWFEFEKGIKEDYHMVKYNNLVSKAYHLPTAFAKKLDEMMVTQADVDFVAYPYFSISSKEVTVDDADFKAYYNENKESFKQDETRNVQYVVFNVNPSADDRKEQKARFDEYYEEFKTVNIADAALFANSASDNRYEDKWYSQGELPVQIDLTMFDGEVGTTVEQYMHDNSYHTARLLDKQMRPTEMKASHILIAYAGALRAAPEVTRLKLDAQNLADSLYQVVRKNKNKIEDLAIEFSNDGGVVENKGHYDWFPDGQMVPEFNEAIVDGKQDDVVLVETDFGFHVIRIDGKRDITNKVKVAMIERSIEPSNSTYQEVYVKANEFASKGTSVDAFEVTAEEMGLSMRIGDQLSPMQSSIPGLDDSRQVVMWAFNQNTKLEEINLFDNGREYIVAVLSKINEEGYRSVKEVEQDILDAVFNRKKAKMMIEKLNASANKTDLNKLAAEFNLKVENVPNLTFDNRGFGVYGPEPDVLSAVFTMNEGGFSSPIMGKKAVYILNLKSLKAAEIKNDYTALLMQMQSRFDAQVNYSLYRNLEENAEIEDNRYRFF